MMQKLEEILRRLHHDLELPDNETSAHLDNCRACLLEDDLRALFVESTRPATPDEQTLGRVARELVDALNEGREYTNKLCRLEALLEPKPSGTV